MLSIFLSMRSVHDFLSFFVFFCLGERGLVARNHNIRIVVKLTRKAGNVWLLQVCPHIILVVDVDLFVCAQLSFKDDVWVNVLALCVLFVSLAAQIMGLPKVLLGLL